MLFGILYFIAILIMLVYSIIKCNVITSFLIGYYLLIAGFSLYAGSQGIIQIEQTTIWGYMLLIIAYLLFFRPWMNSKKIVNFNKTDYSKINNFKPFCYVYIFASIVTIYVYFTRISAYIKSGNWSMIRFQHYQGETERVYSNIFEQYCILISLYLFLLAVLVGMLMLKKKRNSILAYAMLASAVISNIMQALYVAGRGSIFEELLLVIAIFLFVMKGIKKQKTFIMISLLVALAVVIVPIIMSISESRFSNDSENEFLRYFGESPVVFNNNVATIEWPAMGKMCLSTFFDTGFSQVEIGGTWGVRFFTFVGYIYIDWGFIGVFLLGGFFGCYFFNRLIRKKTYRISDLYLLFFYYQTLLKGGLVIGRSYLTTVVYTIIIYCFIRFVIEDSIFQRLFSRKSQRI